MQQRRAIPSLLSLAGLCVFSLLFVFVWRIPSLPIASLLFGLLCVSFWELREPLFFRGWSNWTPLRVWAPPLLIVALAVFRLWPASVGYAFTKHDHSIHVFKGLVMSDQLLPRGTIAGWSHHMFAGYPAGELYPPGGELWVALFDFLTFKTLPSPTVYALAFTAFFAFSGLAVYVLGKRFGGRWVGFLAALFLLFDHGEFRQAGWHYVVNYGVWAQSFGLAWFLLAFVYLDKLLDEPRLRHVLLFGFLTGASILVHPMSLMTAALVFPLHVFVWWLRSERRLRDIAGPLALGLLIGALLAASWLLPFVARKGLTSSVGAVWDSMPALGRRFLEGDLLGGTIAVVSVLGVLGMLLCFRDRRAIRPTTILAGILLVFLSSSTVVVELDLFSLSDSFRKIQYERFMSQAKPFWFVLAAYTIVFAWRAAHVRVSASREGEGVSPWRRMVFIFVLAGLVFGAGRAAVRAAGEEYLGDHPKTARNKGSWKDYQQAAEWLRAQEPEGWWRLAVVDSKHAHELFLLAGMVERQTVKIGFTPAENYRFHMTRTDYELLRRIGVRYLVARKKRTHRLIASARRFGSLWVHEIKDPVLEPWQIAKGRDVSLERFEDEHVSIRLDGVAPGDKMKVLVGYHPRWEASVDGVPVELREVPYRGKAHPLHVMELDASDGLLELRYVSRGVDKLATASFVLALVLMLLLTALRLLPPAQRWLWIPASAWYARNRGRVGIAILCVGAALVLALAVAFVATRVGAGGNERVLFRASDEVGGAEVCYRDRKSGRELACDDWLDDRWTCNKEKTDWRFVAPVAVNFEDLPERCVWAHPINGKTLEIDYGDVPLGSAIAGFVGIEDKAVRKKGSKGAEVTLEVFVDGASVGVAKRRNVEGKKDYRIELPQGHPSNAVLTFEITSPDEHWRNFCFEAMVVE